MKATLLVFAAIALIAAGPGLATAADPCPSNCAPPEPCGWAPDVRKDPTGFVAHYVRCAEDQLP